MRNRFTAVSAMLSIVISTASVSAGVVANYRDDFKTDGTPKAGWGYLWNANGPIGNSANYVALVASSNFGGDYETAAGALPHAAPGMNLAATSTSLVPGQGSAQAADGIERFAIAAYTFGVADVGAAGAEAILDHYRFTVPIDSVDGVSTRIYLNNTLLAPGETILPPGLDYDSSFPGAYPVPLGTVHAGDTLYVAIGSRASDTGDVLGIEYSLLVVPEPGSLGVLALASLLMVRRRGI